MIWVISEGVAVMPNCQDLPPLSERASAQRLEHAQRVLGSQVVTRVLALAMYLLGANRKALAERFKMPLDTVKSLIQRTFQDGLPALEDRRRTHSTFKPHATEKEGPPSRFQLRLEDRHVIVEFDEARRLRIPRDHVEQCRAVLLTLLDAELVDLDEVASALGLSAERTRKLRAKLADDDVHAVFDQRRGQQRDYRMTPEVKAELIQQFMLNLQTHASTSSRQLSEDLEKRSEITVAERTVRQHMATLGLNSLRKSLPKLLQAIKKTPDDPGGGTPPALPGR